MTAHPPVFGPTAPFGDEPEPFVTVRVDYQLTRAQVAAALSYGYAEIAADYNTPAELSVAQIRTEVEHTLAAASIVDLDREMTRYARRSQTDEQRAVLAELDAAIDRAYTRPDPAPLEVQEPVYGDGTVTLKTRDHGEITIPEPAWCQGHDGEQIVQRVDVTHAGRTVAAELETDAGTVEFLPARISWAPFGELAPEPFPVADVEEFPPMSPAQLRELAAEVGLHAGRLYRLSNELDRLRREASS